MPGKPTEVKIDLARSMLGLADRSQLFALLESLFAGDVAKSLAEFQRLTTVGAEPALLLQDLLELTHFISGISLNPALADNIAYSEGERDFARKLAQGLPMASLTRLWQMLLKGLNETRFAPNPASAAEMILIRAAYASGLPTPAEAINSLSLRERAGVRESNPAPATPSPNPLPKGEGFSRPSLITTQPAAPRPISAPAPLPAADAQSALMSFEEVAALFETRREPMLYSYLLREMRLVSFRQGHIEINPGPSVPAEAPGRIGKLLTQWTGSRWVLTVSHIEGQPTLHEQRQMQQQQLKEAARTNPVVAEVLSQFPGAEIVEVTEEKL